jgi:hypothetical protein
VVAPQVLGLAHELSAGEGRCLLSVAIDSEGLVA